MKKNNKKTKGTNYANGGQFFDTVGQLAPLLSLIPGVGSIAAPLVGMGASFLGNQAKQKELQNNGIQATNYSNSAAFGYAEGGDLSQLAQGTYQVNGAPNQTDGNSLNYKGENINLDYGETLDTNKDRVISDKYFNPETGKKFSDEDTLLKRIRAKSEKQNNNSPDLASRNTSKIISKMEDDLFQKHELVASLLGDRQGQQQQQQIPQQMAKGYEDGGSLQPIDSREELLQQMANMIRSRNKLESLSTSERPESFPEDIMWSDGSRMNGVYDQYQGQSNKVMSGTSSNKSSSANKALQQKLIDLGYNNIGKAGIKGDIDGVIGERTKSALRKAIASGKLDKSYESYLNLPSKQSSSKINSKGSVTTKIAEIKQEPLVQETTTPTKDYKWNTNIDWQKMRANSMVDPILERDRVRSEDNKVIFNSSKFKSTGYKVKDKYGNNQNVLIAKPYKINKYSKDNYEDQFFIRLPNGDYDNIKKDEEKFLKAKGFATGGYIDPLNPILPRSVDSLSLTNGLLDFNRFTNPQNQQGNPYTTTINGYNLSPMNSSGQLDMRTSPGARSTVSNRPSLNNVSSIVNGITGGSNSGNSGSGFLGQMTLGEKIGLGGDALSVGLKAIESFRPVQKEPYRYNNAPISLNALDPSYAINSNQGSYNAALNDMNNNSSTGSTRAAQASALFSNRLKADNDVLSKYGEQNSNIANNYEQRLGQRNSENNAMAYQVDDLNSRNRGAAENMRMGVYGDLSVLGLNTSNVINNRLTQNAQLEALKKLAPDVYRNLMDNIKFK